MDCDRFRDDLGRRETGLLDPAAAQDLQQHLVTCDGCRAYSQRMRTLVAVLEEYPEIRELPRRSAFRRLPKSRVAVVAAAILMALAVPAVGPLLGPRTVLEGGFDVPSRNVLVALDSSSAVVAHEHRLRLRKGTRVRLVRADEIFLEEGRLDVSGLREGASGLKIGTPLGRVEVLGTRFVVEVTPVKKSQAAVAAGSFVVGVMVSSGVVTYADYHRLEAGQGIVDETGKAPRRVAAADLDRRLRASTERERDLETRLAALGIEKERLRGDLAALERGETPAPRTPLSPEDRRSRTRRLAQVMVKSFYPRAPAVNEAPLNLDERELNRLLAEKGSSAVEHEVVTKVEADGKALAEVLPLADELGMNFFDPVSFFSKADMVEELLMAVLEARAASASSLRPAVEGAVRAAYGSLPGTWDFRIEERLARARAVQSALGQLEGTLSADQMGDLYQTAKSILSGPEYANLPTADLRWRSEWVDRLAKAMELDAAGRPVLESAVDEMAGRFKKLQEQRSGGSKNSFEYAIQVRELGVELVRQLAARFPDRKEKIDQTLDPR